MNGQPASPIPEALGELSELALDLFWTWSHAGDALWARLEPELWEQLRNPWTILQTISPARLEALAGEQSFLEDLQTLAEERRRHLASPGWFGTQPASTSLGSVAYFSLEFGLSEALPLYAGGLGVLAGDFLKTASDLGVPVCGVGLLYQSGYFRQILDATGRQEEVYLYNEPSGMPIRPARDELGGWLRVPLDLPGRTLLLRVWEALVGRTRLYLLDSNDPLNTPADRGITARLYGGGPTLRFLQELVLGMGGWRALQALGREPEVCHMNEGHAAFAALARVRMLMDRHGLAFREAVWAGRGGNVFTTHTPVQPGFDCFDPGLIRQHFLGANGPFAGAGLSDDDLLALGRKRPADGGESFNMGYLAARLSGGINGVSRLHGAVSRHLFSGLYPRWPEDEVPIGHVTNGVHMPSWDSPAADALWTRTCGKERWRLAHEAACADVCSATDEDLWAMRATQRMALVEVVRRELARLLRQRDRHPGAPPHIEGVFDPNVLTLGFARRHTAYKRTDLLLYDPDRLVRLLTDANAPVQLVVAGNAHPEDANGKRSIERWVDFVMQPAVRRHAVFLEDYDMGLAQELVQGVDVWINTPRRPMEACGTSGMKVLVNGGLNLSALDGWWDEAYAPDVGWAFGDREPACAAETAEPVLGPSSGRARAARQRADDAADAAALLQVIEKQVVPEFYDRDATGMPRRWIDRMRSSMSRLGARYCSNRMLRDYVTDLYVPAAMAVRQRLAKQGAVARDLAGWERTLLGHWEQVHFGRFEAAATRDGWHFTVHVQLGEIAPDHVAVELVADPLPDAPRLRQAMPRGRAIPGTLNGFQYELDVATARPADHFTPRLVPAHPHAMLPVELPLVLWQR